MWNRRPKIIVVDILSTYTNLQNLKKGFEIGVVSLHDNSATTHNSSVPLD